MFSGTFFLRASRRISSRCEPSVTRPFKADIGYEMLSLVTTYIYAKTMKDLYYKIYIYLHSLELCLIYTLFFYFQTLIYDIGPKWCSFTSITLKH